MKSFNIIRKVRDIMAVCFGFLILIVFVAGISAYLTDGDKAINTVTVGGNRVELVEDFEPPEKIEAGVEFKKEVSVKNTGSVDCYVRIKVSFTDSDMEKYSTLDLNTDDFEYNETDGFWYYKEVLEVGEQTPPLFTKVKMSDDLPESEIKDFDILVYTETFQANGFDEFADAWEFYQRNEGAPNRLASLRVTWSGASSVERNSEIDKSLIDVVAVYKDGSTKVLTEDEWSFGQGFTDGVFPNISGDYMVPITYTEKGVKKTGTFDVMVYDPNRQILRLDAEVKDEYETVEAGTVLTEEMFDVTIAYTDGSYEKLPHEGGHYVIEPVSAPNEDGLFEVTISLNLEVYDSDVSASVNMNAQCPEPILMTGMQFNYKVFSSSYVFTDKKAPETLSDGTEVVLKDVSKAQNGSVVSWKDGTTTYVSSQRAGICVIANQDSSEMFYGVSGDIDLSFLDTSRVTDMRMMFCVGGSTTRTSLDLSNFDTSNVENMYGMFVNNTMTSIDLSSFDTSNVTNMRNMFMGCKNITSLDLSNFDTSNVENMYGMFDGCEKLTSLNLSSFNTSNVTDMSVMFRNCKELTSIDLSSFDTSNVDTMTNIFSGCNSIGYKKAFARTQDDADKLNASSGKPTTWSFVVKE